MAACDHRNQRQRGLVHRTRMGVVPTRERRTRSLSRNQCCGRGGLGTPYGPQWCSNEATTPHCGLTGQNLVTPVCWRVGSAAQLAACAWDHRVRGLLRKPFGGLSAVAVKGAEGGLEQLGVPGGEVGGCSPDQAGELAAALQPMQGSWYSRRRPPSAPSSKQPGTVEVPGGSSVSLRSRRCAIWSWTQIIRSTSPGPAAGDSGGCRRGQVPDFRR